MKTVSNERALKQFASSDGQLVLSIIQSEAGFRFVEESQLWEPRSNGLDGYSYWAETHRSGVYASAQAAEAAALQTLGWMVAAEEQS